MLFRRILMTALMTAARNPAVQKKAGEAAGKALNAARPGLLAASRKAGEMTRKISKNMKKTKIETGYWRRYKWPRLKTDAICVR